MNERIAVAFKAELEKISRVTKFTPSLRPKKPSVEEAFYSVRRQPKTIQKRIEQVKIQKRKAKNPFDDPILDH